jgi:hypothetical protein
VQYNSTTDRLDFNVHLRYAFAAGTDLWLVYNERLDADPVRHVLGGRFPTLLTRHGVARVHTYARFRDVGYYAGYC